MLYKEGKISTGLALELAGMDLIAFLDECKKRAIKVKTGTSSSKEIEKDINGLTDG